MTWQDPEHLQAEKVQLAWEDACMSVLAQLGTVNNIK
jgi:hypothetical protein